VVASFTVEDLASSDDNLHPRHRRALQDFTQLTDFIPDLAELSIVIPVYNEEENVGPLIQEINAR
jgi:hypothetical protein